MNDQMMSSLANADPQTRNRWLCIQAFHNRDYPRCAELAQISLETVTSPVEMRLLLIALQRLQRHDQIEVLAPRLLEAVRDVPWESALLRLILGTAPIDQVMSSAANKVQQCEARFYAAIRLLHEEQVEAARAQLLAVMTLDFPECYEFLMAASEYHALPSMPALRRWWQFWKRTEPVPQITGVCGFCDAPFGFGVEKVGQTVKCPNCAATMLLPKDASQVVDRLAYVCPKCGVKQNPPNRFWGQTPTCMLCHSELETR